MTKNQTNSLFRVEGRLSSSEIEENRKKIENLMQRGMTEEAYHEMQKMLEELKRNEKFSGLMASEVKRAWREAETKAQEYRKIADRQKVSYMERKGEMEQDARAVKQLECQMQKIQHVRKEDKQ